MTDKNTGNDESRESRQSRESRHSSVWSDLRAMRLLERLQQDVQKMKTAQRNLQIAIVIAFILLGGGAVVLGIIYNQLQQLRSQPEAAKPSMLDRNHRWENASEAFVADQLPIDSGDNHVSRRRTRTSF
jgi:hypothetical protein